MSKAFHTIEVVDALPDANQQQRLLSYLYLPGSFRDGSISPVKVQTVAITQSATIANNSGTNFTTLRSTRFGNWWLVFWDLSVFVGSTSDPAANLMPGGSAVSMGGWIMNGPALNFPYDTSAAVGDRDDLDEARARVQIRNVSGSDAVVTLIRRYKYVSNLGDSSV